MTIQSCNHMVGVDLGGTNVRAAVVTREGQIIGEGRRPSLAMEEPEVSIGQIIEAIREAMDRAGVTSFDVCGIGMAVPGRHNSKEGIVIWSPNFKDMWRGVKLAAPIREAIGVPVYMANDANTAALGEFRFGAGRDVNSMVMITLGTGVGGGVIIDGKVLGGSSSGGGEIGHQVINPNSCYRCECGNFGDLEAEARRDTIIERALREIYAGRESLLTTMVEPKYLDLTPATIAQAASKGDQVSLEVMAETGRFVGIGVANAINFLNPDMVVIGGGISQAGDVLWEPIRRTVCANALEESLDVCQIVPAKLGDNAGIMGGVVLVLQASSD